PHRGPSRWPCPQWPSGERSHQAPQRSVVTAASLVTPAPASGLRLPLAFAIALRELRAGAGGLTVFVLCIALGVMAVAAIGSLGASFDCALAPPGRPPRAGALALRRVR